MKDLVGQIMDFESGQLSKQGILELFSELIKTGQAWTLQGFYGRTANFLIENGLITRKGEIIG